jgi:hypothetical protein
MGEQLWGTYVPHTPCPLHISLALRRQNDHASLLEATEGKLFATMGSIAALLGRRCGGDAAIESESERPAAASSIPIEA